MRTVPATVSATIKWLNMMLNPEEVASVIEHMNADHADAVRSCATVRGRPDVVAARLTGIERDALILECSGVEQRFELEVRLRNRSRLSGMQGAYSSRWRAPPAKRQPPLAGPSSEVLAQTTVFQVPLRRPVHQAWPGRSAAFTVL